MGRTLEHLGVQLYKHRDAAIAEIVANAWDAGAKRVEITLPAPSTYDAATSEIVIEDDGCGMDPDAVEEQYLVVGRNRRAEGDAVADPSRAPMGRKGIGKLAAFGVAEQMQLTSTADGKATTFTLDAKRLKTAPGSVNEVPIDAVIDETSSEPGTRIVLRGLKHATPLTTEALREALGRRFSRTIRGSMTIDVDGEAVTEPALNWASRVPETGAVSEDLGEGRTIQYAYGFADSPISQTDLRGWVVYVRGKTAQRAPWYFGVEGTASGQHATKYLSGYVEADFLDDGTDDESDLISTDRQEIDWEDAAAKPLQEWGAEFTRKILREWASRRGDDFRDWVVQQPSIKGRLERLDKPSRDQATRILKSLGSSDNDQQVLLELADSLVRAFEYRQFHDVISQVETVENDPAQLELLLSHLREWKVLESRAILEIVKGRIEIIDKFHSMIANDAPETAPHVGTDNMHDLLAEYPWLIHPEWQVLAEEKTLTKQLREWGAEEIDESERSRYDFLALLDGGRLVIIEIKRAGHLGSLEDLQRLERYKDRLSQGTKKNLRMVFISSGRMEFPTLSEWEKRSDLDLVDWSELHDRAKDYYAHYRQILEGDVGGTDFARKEDEVARTRSVLDTAAYRSPDQRRAGLGPQDSVAAEPDDE